mmetsp:Transcript_317/g.969  ORF Transcript_317/g.969 Transcript_317/m.969 type:complete len:231 (-) Transcript_317:1177-1869(-)
MRSRIAAVRQYRRAPSRPVVADGVPVGGRALRARCSDFERVMRRREGPVCTWGTPLAGRGAWSGAVSAHHAAAAAHSFSSDRSSEHTSMNGSTSPSTFRMSSRYCSSCCGILYRLSPTLTLQRTAMPDGSIIEWLPSLAPIGGRVHGLHLSEYCATIFHSNCSARNARNISSIMSAGGRKLTTPSCQRFSGAGTLDGPGWPCGDGTTCIACCCCCAAAACCACCTACCAA